MKKGTKSGGWSQLWKRNAVVTAIALFVCAGVYLNWSYEQDSQAGKTLGQATMVGKEKSDLLVEGTESAAEETVGGPSGYFATARLNRQQARDSALALLQEAAAGEQGDEKTREQVNATIQTMADYTVTEAQIENLVIAKGFEECVAFIGEEALSIAVSASEGGLTPGDTARIVDVVNQAAGYTADQIKIIEVE